MTREQVLKEYRDFPLTETEIGRIVSFYKTGAELLSTCIGHRILDEETPLKLVLNSIKHTVILMLELRNEETKRSS